MIANDLVSLKPSVLSLRSAVPVQKYWVTGTRWYTERTYMTPFYPLINRVMNDYVTPFYPLINRVMSDEVNTAFIPGIVFKWEMIPHYTHRYENSINMNSLFTRIISVCMYPGAASATLFTIKNY